MIKVFKTNKPRIFFIFEDKISSIVITKCTGHLSEGIFLGEQVKDRREIRGSNIADYREILDNCFTTVFEQDIIEGMKKRLAGRR